MHADDLHIHAAVGIATQTCATVTAVQIGAYAALIAYLQIMVELCWPDLDNFDGEFMTQDTWIGKKRLVALERM
jgi:hypothetical protein